MAIAQFTTNVWETRNKDKQSLATLYTARHAVSQQRHETLKSISGD